MTKSLFFPTGPHFKISDRCHWSELKYCVQLSWFVHAQLENAGFNNIPITEKQWKVDLKNIHKKKKKKLTIILAINIVLFVTMKQMKRL